jgi:hypothetical protein
MELGSKIVRSIIRSKTLLLSKGVTRGKWGDVRISAGGVNRLLGFVEGWEQAMELVKVCGGDYGGRIKEEGEEEEEEVDRKTKRRKEKERKRVKYDAVTFNIMVGIAYQEGRDEWPMQNLERLVEEKEEYEIFKEGEGGGSNVWKRRMYLLPGISRLVGRTM